MPEAGPTGKLPQCFTHRCGSNIVTVEPNTEFKVVASYTAYIKKYGNP